MYKLILLLFFISVFQFSKGQDTDNVCMYDNPVSTLGLGLILAPSGFDVYNDSLLKQKYIRCNMDTLNAFMPKICSKFYKPDYEIMHFVCIGKMATAYKIIINNSDIKYLPRRREYVFKTWNEYILQSYGIRSETNEPLRKEPLDNGDTLSVNIGDDIVCPIQLKGDWVKVQYNCSNKLVYDSIASNMLRCDQFINKCKDPQTGWLRWRQKNNLLIGIFVLGD